MTSAFVCYLLFCYHFLQYFVPVQCFGRCAMSSLNLSLTTIALPLLFIIYYILLRCPCSHPHNASCNPNIVYTLHSVLILFIFFFSYILFSLLLHLHCANSCTMAIKVLSSKFSLNAQHTTWFSAMLS